MHNLYGKEKNVQFYNLNKNLYSVSLLDCSFNGIPDEIKDFFKEFKLVFASLFLIAYDHLNL